jgi:hypothetical protein
VFGSDQAAGKRSFVYISAAHWYTNGKISTHQFILPKEHSKWTCLSRRMLLTLRSVCTYHRYNGFQGQRTKPGMESSTLLAPDRILSFKAVSRFSVPRSSNVNFRDPKPGIINLNSNLLSGTSDRETAAKLRRCHPSICSMDSGIPRFKLPSTGLNSFRSNLFYVSNFDQRASSG